MLVQPPSVRTSKPNYFDSASNFAQRQFTWTNADRTCEVLGAAYLVAPIQALAQEWLETVACVSALRRVQACAPARFNSFSFPLVSLSLRESCIRQIRLCSLGGGRRLALNGAPPPTRLGFSVLLVETDVIDEELEGTCGSSGGEGDGSYVPAVGATKGGEGK
jgi:hypothetical protein